MKIEKLTEDKIRITLNLDDLKERDIDYHSFMSSSIETQSIFLDMLNTAEKEVGFETNDCRIMIEAIALKDGSFIFTITKFAGEKSPLSSRTASSKKKTLHIKRKSPAFVPTKTIYAFESFDSFCDFCTLLNKSAYKESLSYFAKKIALYEYNTAYYLILTDIDLDLKISHYICPIITEFAHFVDNSDLFERKILEYGTAIIEENAIQTCIKYFI